ncbi:MAG: hypothetical protein WDM85_00170 [Caulobacteraceae bacterium]
MTVMRKMAARIVAALMLLAGVLAAAPAFAAAVDPRAEVAAALFAASATQAAEQRVADATIRAERVQIDKLTLQVRSGEAQRAALVAAQDHYVAELAARDRSYSAGDRGVSRRRHPDRLDAGRGRSAGQVQRRRHRRGAVHPRHLAGGAGPKPGARPTISPTPPTRGPPPNWRSMRAIAASATPTR